MAPPVVLMNSDQYCNFCMDITQTKEWDCTICGLSKPYLPKIYITGDTHGGADSGMSKFYSKNFLGGKKLTKQDFVIVAGDFGGIWYPLGTHKYKKQDLPFQRFLQDKKWTTLFIDGNHENHDMLAQLEQVEMFGGIVGKVNDSIFHLKRGYVYTISDKKFFCLGGAESTDKENRTIGISWWKEEVPSYKEMDFALEQLELHNWEVDYVITHNCPNYVAQMFISHHNAQGLYNTKINCPAGNFLEYIRTKLKYEKWYYGHWHENWKWDKFQLLYNKIERIL